MWTFVQKTGELIRDGKVVGVGYAGHGDGLDNPIDENVRNEGPLPVGRYSIGVAFDHPRMGPVVMRLYPYADNVMFGRSGFLIHGDNAAMNHSASDGCIIMPHPVRVMIANSTDRALTVVAELEPATTTVVPVDA
jgi:hypothetical protein